MKIKDGYNGAAYGYSPFDMDLDECLGLSENITREDEEEVCICGYCPAKGSIEDKWDKNELGDWICPACKKEMEEEQ